MVFNGMWHQDISGWSFKLVGPPWFRLVCPVYPTAVQSELVFSSHINVLTQGFPREHCPEQYTASIGLPSSHSVCWCLLPQLGDFSSPARWHPPGLPHDVKENVSYQSKPPSSIVSWSHSDSPLSNVGAFCGGPVSAWALLLVCGIAVLNTASTVFWHLSVTAIIHF